MIKSLRAENFRCFKEIEISELQRVNVVVGKNATGKTALLEAIRLALGGTPNVLWGMNPARGFWGGALPSQSPAMSLNHFGVLISSTLMH